MRHIIQSQCRLVRCKRSDQTAIKARLSDGERSVRQAGTAAFRYIREK